MAPFKSTQSFSVGQFLRTFRNRDAVGPAALNSPVRTYRIPVQATGGTASIPGNGYQYHYFTGPGNFSVLLGGLTQADYLIIGGGGSGGNAPDTGSYQGAGGGGAGEFLTGQITTLQVASYPVVIGAGGLYSGASGLPAAYPAPLRPTPQNGPFPGSTGWYGGNGDASTFNAPGANGVSALSAAGGGSGGGGTNAAGGGLGQVGGSAGGGGGYAPTSPGIIAGSGDQYPGSGSSFPSPSNGWGSDTTADTIGTGGGGAGQRGGAGHSGNAGGAGLPAFNGDTGIPPSYGVPGPSAGRWFAGGGGLGADGPGNGPYAGGAGGGGGGGVILDRPGTNATANTGSGGGGSGADNWPSPAVLGAGGSGADGIVIIRYAV